MKMFIIVVTVSFLAMISSAANAAHYRHYRHYASSYSYYSYSHYDNGEIIGRAPAGCPRASCGCIASIAAFGHVISNLFLASNWFKFPSATPESGMAAVRNHHVFIILRNLGNGTVFADDGNSGGGLTRDHVVSLRGYRVVNPHG